MRNKTILIAIIFFSLMLFVFPLAESVIIAAQEVLHTTFFIPDGTYTYDYTARTTRDNQEVIFTARGDLQDYMSFEPQGGQGGAKGDYIPFKMTINFPSEISPGKHTNYICVEEAKAGGQGIAVKTEACARIDFISLYEGKYVVARFDAPNANVGDTVEFSTKVENWGTETISSLSANVEVFEGETQIATVSTDKQSLDSKGKVNLIASWNSAGKNQGEYSAKATVFYDGESIDAGTDDFLLGTLDIDIVDYTKQAKINTINEFTIDVKSNWNSNIPSIYGEVSIEKEGTEIKSFKTVSENLAPWQVKKLTGYLDTNGIESTGTYDVEITVYYMNEETKESGQIEITDAMTEKPKSEAINLNNTTLIIIVFVVLVVVMTLVIYKFKHGKKV